MGSTASLGATAPLSPLTWLAGVPWTRLRVIENKLCLSPAHPLRRKEFWPQVDPYGKCWLGYGSKRDVG
jgi:hypothetical protein